MLQGKKNEKRGSAIGGIARIRSETGKEKEDDEKEAEKEGRRKIGVKASLTDSLQVYSDIQKEQRVPVFILLTGTIICPFALFLSLARFCYLSQFFSSPSPPPPELSHRRDRFKTLRLIY